MTVQEIIEKHTGLWSVKFPSYLHDSYIKAMKEIAEKSYEAGWNRGYEYSMAEDEDTVKIAPKEQFINDLFNTSKTEK